MLITILNCFGGQLVHAINALINKSWLSLDILICARFFSWKFSFQYNDIYANHTELVANYLKEWI